MSPEPVPSNSLVNGQPIQESLDKYLAHLKGAQEEQEQLEDRLENERLHEEFDPLEQSPGGKPSQQASSSINQAI